MNTDLSECCPTCGGTRYCAPARCYCGHKECPAYASWIDIRSQPFKEPHKAKPRSSWDEREEETWIDQL